MEALLTPKRPLDTSTADVPETPPTSNVAPNISSAKRRHHQPSFSSTASPSSVTFKPLSPLFKLAAGETLFRILCPATKTGHVIGKGGVVVRQLRDETGARIRIHDSALGWEERVIVIVGDSAKKVSSSTAEANETTVNIEPVSQDTAKSTSNLIGEEVWSPSPAQQALVRVFERTVKVDADGSGLSAESGEKGDEKEEGGNVGISGPATPQGPVVCKLLAPCNQVGRVLGRGGKVVERIRHDSGAQIRVLPRDQIPSCALAGDELIQITGNFSAVRKALLSVSSCLQDNPRADVSVPAATRTSNAVAFHGAGTESSGSNKKIVEEEVVFKLLCQADKVGSLIGKGGSIIRALENDTGASIQITDAAPESDERVVVISARENSDQRHSPAQEAVIRVHCRITEVAFEPGAVVVARLLVYPHQVGCLLGKGGIIISELRRGTGTNIRIQKHGSLNDEVVQVVGSLQCVQDALYQITSRLRDTIFPMRPYNSSSGVPSFLPPYPEMPPPMFRPRHDPTSPGTYHSPAGPPHGVDRAAFPTQTLEPLPFSHVMNHVGPNYFDHIPHPHGGGPARGSSFDTQSSPRGWVPQTINAGNPRGVTDAGGGFTMTSGPMESGNQVSGAAITTVEVAIPHTFLSYVCGEKSTNLGHIRQMSGAMVVVHDPKPGSTEGIVVLSGMPDQLYLAQTLIHAFIQSELLF